MAVSTLKYLKEQLNFSMSEWSKLSDKDKDDLKSWAKDEIEATEQAKAA